MFFSKKHQRKAREQIHEKTQLKLVIMNLSCVTSSDADYLKFLEELKKPTTPLPSAEEQLDKRLAETQGLQL